MRPVYSVYANSGCFWSACDTILTDVSPSPPYFHGKYLVVKACKETKSNVAHPVAAVDEYPNVGRARIVGHDRPFARLILVCRACHANNPSPYKFLSL